MFPYVKSNYFALLPESEAGIFRQILRGKLDLESDPWPSISDSAKDLVRKMLTRDPTKRLTAHEVLCKFSARMPFLPLFEIYDRCLCSCVIEHVVIDYARSSMDC